MRTRWPRFNIILVLMLAPALLACGCRSSEKKKDREATVLRFYVETNPDATGNQISVQIGRSAPFVMVVESRPFLSEVFVTEASLLEVPGGFEISLQLDRQGTWLLDQHTTSNIGKHLALYAQFGASRWIAAPRIKQRISDGRFVFTPDTTREEADRLVRGLQNVAKEVKKGTR